MILKSSGENVWFIPVILKSRCKIDIEYFPFDEQRCPLKFGSWTYHGLELDFSLAQDEADLLQYQPNGEFHLISAHAKRQVTKYRSVKKWGWVDHLIFITGKVLAVRLPASY